MFLRMGYINLKFRLFFYSLKKNDISLSKNRN